MKDSLLIPEDTYEDIAGRVEAYIDDMIHHNTRIQNFVTFIHISLPKLDLMMISLKSMDSSIK